MASQESFSLAKQADSHGRLGRGRGIKIFVFGRLPSVSTSGVAEAMEMSFNFQRVVSGDPAKMSLMMHI